VPFFYQSGAKIMKGDKVLLHGEPGEIESVVDPATDPEDWFVTEHGGGVLILEPNVFGRLFVSDTQNYEDLELVSRA
jgi:hypothetical protein